MAREPFAKICGACGRDCSTRRRARDARGRYLCHECQRAGRTVPDDDRLAPAPIAPRSGPVPVAIDTPVEDTSGVECAVCMRPLPADTLSCIECRYSHHEGIQPTTLVLGRHLGRGAMVCRCGYEVRGLRSLRCPECGRPVKPASQREEEAVGTLALTRRQIVTSAAMTLVGLAVCAGAAALAGGLPELGRALLGYGLAFPAGLAVYALWCAMIAGSDLTLGGAAIRLAGIFAVSDAVAELLFGTIGPSLPTWSLPVLVGAYLLIDQLELEVHDAVISAVLIHVARMSVIWGLVPAIT